MNVKIYRIDRSLSGKVGHFFKKPDLPVMTGMIGNPLKVFRDVMAENVFILHTDDEINRFSDPTGHSLVDDIYYIRHPKEARTKYLIPATSFHNYIIKEQIADIVSYIRANTSVKKLKISIASSVGSKVHIKAILEDVPVEGNAGVSFSSSNEVIIESNTPLKPSERRKDYIWMNDFQTTLAVIDNITDAHISITEKADLKFGIGLDLAKQIGISGECLANYEYKLECDAV